MFLARSLLIRSYQSARALVNITIIGTSAPGMTSLEGIAGSICGCIDFEVYVVVVQGHVICVCRIAYKLTSKVIANIQQYSPNCKGYGIAD